ncbi:major facilitator superfamily domain-containing protein [Lipomyces japonicus]|uniref:major facilitator superfamily domain-containing protein n=1 Tax=Lipomyces japonicus TaxID=56871 RepID=UPI0034CF7470
MQDELNVNNFEKITTEETRQRNLHDDNDNDGDNEHNDEEKKLGTSELSGLDVPADREKNLVSWDNDDDPANPLNFSLIRKWVATLITSTGALCVACSSSIYTAAYPGIEKEFGCKEIEAITGLTLFVFGMGAGPMFYSPLSEFFGRRIIYLLSFAFFLAFQFPVAFGKNIEAILINRLLSGLAGSAFMAVAGGTVSDCFVKEKLGAPMMVFTAAPFLGPSLGPLFGNFIAHRLSWRWIIYVMIIWTGVMLILIFFFVPETYSPVLLRWKAQRLRKQTGNQELYAPIETLDRSIMGTVVFSCKRPFQLLFLEPMVFSLCLYTAILLGINYLFFQAFPLVFMNNHGFERQHVGLPFLGLFVGVILGVSTEHVWRKKYARLAESHGGARPEFRLPQAMVGSIFCPIGMFWFAFTTYKSVHYIVPILSGVPFGLGIILVFSGVFTYLVEAYRPYSASALAANGFLRSSFAAAFPLFSVSMYDNLGYAWASALLAFLTLACVPLPFLFYRFGERLRRRSKFAWSADVDQKKRKEVL